MDVSTTVKSRLPALALIIVAVAWGWSFAFTKGVLLFIGPIAFTSYSFLLAGAIFFVISLWRRERNFFSRWREGLLLGVLLFFVEVPQTIGLAESSAQNTAFISNAGMLLLPLFGYIVLHEKLRIRHAVAFLSCALGIYVFTGGLDSLVSGDLWLFVSALAMPLYFGFSAKYEQKQNSNLYLLCTQQFIVIGVLAHFFIESTPIIWSHTLVGDFLILTIFTNVGPYFLAQWAERKVTAIAATFIYTLEPIFGGIFAWTLGHEPITDKKLIGGLLIVLAMLISQIGKNEVPSIHGVKRRKMVIARNETL